MRNKGVNNFYLPELQFASVLKFPWWGQWNSKVMLTVDSRLCRWFLSPLSFLLFKTRISYPVLFSRSVMSESLWPHGLQHSRLLCPLPSPGVCSSSCPLNQWCHPNISSSVFPFSSHLQSFPASGSFPMSQFFTSGGQSMGTSASVSALPINIQGWFPLGLTGLISSLSKGLSRVFSNTTVQKHHFFSAQLFLLSNSHTHRWLLERP